MGSCYSGDHIARDNIHTDITTYNIVEPRKCNALERSIKDYLGGGGGKDLTLEGVLTYE